MKWIYYSITFVLFYLYLLLLHSFFVFCLFYKCMRISTCFGLWCFVGFSLTMVVCEAIVKELSPIYSKLVCDELKLWTWLVAWKHLIIFISTCHELCNKLAHQTFLDNVVKLDVTIFDAKLEELQIRMKWQILEMLLHVISFLHTFDSKKDHQMLTLMLDLIFKNIFV